MVCHESLWHFDGEYREGGATDLEAYGEWAIGGTTMAEEYSWTEKSLFISKIFSQFSEKNKFLCPDPSVRTNASIGIK